MKQDIRPIPSPVSAVLEPLGKEIAIAGFDDISHFNFKLTTMTSRITTTALLLIASMLCACNGKKPEDKATPDASHASRAGHDAATDEASSKANDATLKNDIDALSTRPIALFGGTDQAIAKIAANGDFSIGGAKIAIDDTQRQELVAYRQKLLLVVIPSKELNNISTDLASNMVGGAIDRIFGDETPEDQERTKAAADSLKSSLKRICDAVPALVQQQETLIAVLPEFRPYASLTKADAIACTDGAQDSRSTSENLGKTIGIALGNPFSSGMAAGAIAAYIEAKAKKNGQNATAKSEPSPEK